MSVITNSPVPQMQLHTIFTELHVQVSPRTARGVVFPRAGQALGAGRGGALGPGGVPTSASGGRVAVGPRPMPPAGLEAQLGLLPACPAVGLTSPPLPALPRCAPGPPPSSSSAARTWRRSCTAS